MPSENQDFKIIFGCRTSPLAQKQADLCVQALRKNSPFSSYLIKTFSTMGDKNKEAMLRDLGGKGVFCREIDRACLMGDIDIANIWGIARSYDKIPEGQVALAAWGVLDRMDGVDEGRITQFFEAYAGSLGPESITCR